LLTLTGTGGIGKTRLAIQIATALLYDFIDGVYFVALASINDPGLVMPTIAQTLMNKQQQTKLKPYGFCSLPQKDGLLHRPKWGI
jgi:predicted ATPase